MRAPYGDTHAPDLIGIAQHGVRGSVLAQRRHPDWEIHNVVLKKELLDGSPFIRGGGKDDVNGMISINPGLHGVWINSLLAKGVDVRWSTTWQEAANDVLPPILGIPELPVAVSTRLEYPRIGYVKTRDSAAWKAETLKNQFPSRRIVWIDDNGSTYIASGRPEPIHCVVPDPSVGLTVEQMKLVDHNIDRHLTAQAARSL